MAEPLRRWQLERSLTMLNADTDGRVLIEMIEQFAKEHDNAHAYVSFGQLRHCRLCPYRRVVGNSWSGLRFPASRKAPSISAIGSEDGYRRPA
jgi:GDP/UDP-N,N'-diacetylbacillosamine 2-epimerase (hydrolysing)